MPKVIRHATVVLSADELSKALGFPFDNVQNIEWLPATETAPRGLKLTVQTEEEISLPRTLPHKQK